MFSALNTKLLVVAVALLASIASYVAYEKHKEEVAEQKRREFYRPPRPDEKKSLDSLTAWGSSPATQNKK
ncbi:MAG TPA: hypothetical protein VMF91_20470 [Bryobacteraceae bacterium]|jgi:hypothetical protein|nr:hypothetical protein [Bryobacteraceae bacterium]